MRDLMKFRWYEAEDGRMSYFSLTNKINFVAPRRNLSAEIFISGTDHVSRGCVRRNTNNVRLEVISHDVFSVLIKGLDVYIF